MSNFIKVGGVTIQVKADGTLARSELSKLEKQFEKSGEKMSGTGGKITKIFNHIKAATMAVGVSIAAAFAGFVAWMKKSIPLASDFHEANNRLLTVFKDIKGQASAAARGLTSYGFSLIEATKTLGSVGDVLTGLGMGQQSALKMSDTIARLSQDLVSFTNFSGGVAGASDIITKALLGERDGLISLGVKLNDVDLQRMGYTQNMSREAKAELTLKAIMQQSKNAMGDYARTQNSFANQTRKLGQNFKDLSVRVGQALLPAIGSLVGWMNKQFDSSKSLIDMTYSLNEAMRSYLSLTKQLTTASDKLNKSERNRLLIEQQKALIKINETMSKILDKQKIYQKYSDHHVKFILDTYKGQKSILFTDYTINAREIDFLRQHAQALSFLTSGYARAVEAGHNLTASEMNDYKKYSKELNTIKTKIVNYDSAIDSFVTAAANGITSGLWKISKFSVLGKDIMKQIREQVKYLKFHPLAITTNIDTKLKPPKKKDIEYWEANFAERMQVKINIGYDKQKAEKELDDWINKEKHKAWYNTIKLRIESHKSVTVSQKKYLDEYIAAQKLLNDLKKRDAEIEAKAAAEQKQKLAALKSSLKTIYSDLESVAGVLGQNVSPETQKTLDKIKEWKNNLELVIKVVNDVSTAIKAAEKAQAAAKIAAGDWVAIIAAAISILVTAWDAIFQSAEEKAKEALKSVDKDIRELNHKVAMGVGGSLREQINAYQQELAKLQAVKQTDDVIREEYQIEEKIYQLKQQERQEQEKILDAYKQAYELQAKTLGGGTAQGTIDYAKEQLPGLESNLKTYKDIYSQYKNENTDEIMRSNLKRIWGIKNEYLLNQTMIHIKEHDAGWLEAQGGNASDILGMYDSLVNTRNRMMNHFSALATQTEGKIKGLKELLDSLQDEAIKESVTKFEHEVSMGQHKDINEQIDFYKQKLDEMNKHNLDVQNKINALLGKGKDFTDPQVKLLAQQLISTSDIYTIEEKIHSLEKSKTSEMQKQLDIQREINRLKKTGLFDEQNLYQARQLGSLMRSQNYSVTQQIDVLNNLNVSGMAAHRVVNIYGGINTEVNEATGDSLDTAMNNVLVNMLGGM